MQDVLASLLVAHPSIRAIVDRRVDWDRSVQGEGDPRIVMTLISEPHQYANSGRVNFTTSRVQFDCITGTAMETRRLAAALDGLLSGYRGVWAGIRFEGMFKAGHRTRFDKDGPNEWFQAQIDYLIHWAKA